MPVERMRNDLGGESIYVEPPSDFVFDPKVAGRLSADERQAAQGFSEYFTNLSEKASPEMSAFLQELANATPVVLELHQATYDERMSGTFFRVEFSSGVRMLVGVRRSTIPTNMPCWLAELYEVIGATREQEWQVSGGFLFPDRLGTLEGPSEYCPPSPIDLSAARAFFATCDGDYLCYGPDTQCYWFEHETESLKRVEDPRALIGDIFAKHLAGSRVVVP